jgi:hypothetical protein
VAVAAWIIICSEYVPVGCADVESNREREGAPCYVGGEGLSCDVVPVSRGQPVGKKKQDGRREMRKQPDAT